MKKKNKQLDWFFGALQYFSSLVVVLLVGGRENAARCSVATSAVCIMTFGRCRAHIHLCGRLSASFTDSASLTRPASRPQVWSLCGDRRCFSKTPGHVLRQSTLLLARYFKTQGFRPSVVGCVCVQVRMCLCVCLFVFVLMWEACRFQSRFCLNRPSPIQVKRLVLSWMPTGGILIPVQGGRYYSINPRAQHSVRSRCWGWLLRYFEGHQHSHGGGRFGGFWSPWIMLFSCHYSSLCSPPALIW